MKKRYIVSGLLAASVILSTTAYASGVPAINAAQAVKQIFVFNKDGKQVNSKDATIKTADGKNVSVDGKNVVYIKKANLPKNFDQMSTQEKRDWMISNITNSINDQVKAGKLTQAEADKMISNIKTKMSNWDGTGAVKIQKPAQTNNAN